MTLSSIAAWRPSRTAGRTISPKISVACSSSPCGKASFSFWPSVGVVCPWFECEKYTLVAVRQVLKTYAIFESWGRELFNPKDDSVALGSQRLPMKFSSRFDCVSNRLHFRGSDKMTIALNG